METKRLYRSTDNRILGGVAAGIAQYFDIDPIIVRLIFVLLTLGNGIGILFYFVAWLIIPEQPSVTEAKTDENSPTEKKELGDEIHDRVNEVADEIRDAADKFKTKRPDNGRSVAGMILLVLGALFLANNFFDIDVWDSFWPIILIVIGLGIILNSHKRI